MERSFAFVREGAQLLHAWNEENGAEPYFTLECVNAGLRMKATYKRGDQHFTQENITPWQSFTSVGLRSNPLAAAFEALLRKVQEHKTSE